MTLTARAVEKVIACIDSCTTMDHLACCNRMITSVFMEPYRARKNTMTYLTMKYRKKKADIYNE